MPVFSVKSSYTKKHATLFKLHFDPTFLPKNKKKKHGMPGKLDYSMLQTGSPGEEILLYTIKLKLN